MNHDNISSSRITESATWGTISSENQLLRSEEEFRILCVALVVIAKVHLGVLNVGIVLEGHDAIVAVPGNVLGETVLGRDDPAVVDDGTGADALTVLGETDNPRPGTVLGIFTTDNSIGVDDTITFENTVASAD